MTSLAGVYKIQDAERISLGVGMGWRHPVVCPNRRNSALAGRVALEIEQRKEPLLKRSHTGETTGAAGLVLASLARVDDQRFADVAEFFQQPREA